jgi:hypothetical protein
MFELGPFRLPSGEMTFFKVECDDLTDEDWAALARLAVEIIPPFGAVEGVPRGGLKFAEALEPYAEPYTQPGRLLIADDVWVSGRSVRAYLDQRQSKLSTICVVAFTRNPVPDWVTPLFQMHPRAEAATYRLGQQSTPR